jgi:beta-ureidopropionase
MLTILRVGLSQTSLPAGAHEPDELVELALAARLREIEEAVRVGVQLLAFPELCCLPWFLGGPDERWLQRAWTADSPELGRVQRAAGLHRCVVVFPFLERAPGGRLHSSAAVIDANGALRCVVRRQHVPEPQRSHIVGGRGAFPVVDTAAGRIGVVLGSDLHHPEVGRILGLRGAELMLIPTGLTTDHPRALWEAEPLALAAQNRCWVGACNRVGSETLRGPEGARVREHAGGSYLADLRGRFHARASRDQPALIRADLPLGRLRRDRGKMDDSPRRPGIYHALVE